MNIALLGYGRMGKAIEKFALERGHKIVYILDESEEKGVLTNADVAINFSIPQAAADNIKSALSTPTGAPAGIRHGRAWGQGRRAQGRGGA